MAGEGTACSHPGVGRFDMAPSSRAKTRGSAAVGMTVFGGGRPIALARLRRAPLSIPAASQLLRTGSVPGLFAAHAVAYLGVAPLIDGHDHLEQTLPLNRSSSRRCFVGAVQRFKGFRNGRRNVLVALSEHSRCGAWYACRSRTKTPPECIPKCLLPVRFDGRPSLEVRPRPVAVDYGIDAAHPKFATFTSKNDFESATTSRRIAAKREAVIDAVIDAIL
jgi:hypothetical protein